MAKKTTMYEGREVEYIDCTPTWEGILPLYLRVLENGNEEGKDAARKELVNMAKIADMYVAFTKLSKEEQIAAINED